ncbi:MAG: vWA domain-containing protein [Vicinamibacterales bacterium]
MSVSASLTAIVREVAAAWRNLSIESYQFWHRDAARLALIGLVAASVVLLLIRLALARKAGRHYLLVPALLRSLPASKLSWLRHAPMVLCVVGVPFAVLALADPYSSLVTETVTYPGRRISLMIDASDSMQTSFKAATLNTRSEVQPAFFTAVAAAERFVQLRRKGRYRDLMALVEFGNRAYVITPFTSDYDNLLLSLSLIGDPVEFSLFPESGTLIASALEESIEIFKAFNFLEASGNLMVIFTDGEDTTSIVHGRSLDDILKSAVDNAIPLYFVWTNYGKNYGEGIPDAQWRAAVEKTGGKYYIAKDEASLLAAVSDIDRVSVGAIETTQYANQQPRFSIFVLLSIALWASAATLRLATPWFGKIP